MASEGYPYDPEWKAGVSRNGEDWRAYCEAVHCLKRYFLTKASQGKEAAKSEYERYCARLATEPRLGAYRAARLKADFLLVGTFEGDALKAEVGRDGARQE